MLFRLVKTILALSVAAALFHPGGARATADMATMSCQDWMDASDDEQDQMVAWLRGYLASRSSATVFDYSDTAARVARGALMVACRRDPTIGVISAGSKGIR
jgi:hypothetical protein